MTQVRFASSLREHETPDLRNRIVFRISTIEKCLGMLVAGASLMLFWMAWTHPLHGPVDAIIRIFDFLFAAFVVYYLFSFSLTIGDGFIVKHEIGKFQALSFDEIESWRVCYSFKPFGKYIIESRSGITLRFPSTLERARELERILNRITMQECEHS